MQVGAESVEQGVKPAPQPTAHLPAEHVVPSAQASPQAPQFSESLARSWQEPSLQRTAEPEQGLLAGGKSVRAQAVRAHTRPIVTDRIVFTLRSIGLKLTAK